MEIINKASHSFKRMIQKAYIEVHRKTRLPREEKAPFHNECVEICRRVIGSSDTILLIAPISSQRYMKNEKFGIYIIFSGRTVEIVNHVYNYTVPLDDSTWSILMREFDEELEERREDFEDEIGNNIKYSLKTILKTIGTK